MAFRAADGARASAALLGDSLRATFAASTAIALTMPRTLSLEEMMPRPMRGWWTRALQRWADFGNASGARFNSVLCAPLAGCSFCALVWLAVAAPSGSKASRSMACALLLLLSGPVGFVPIAEAAALENAGGVPTAVREHAPPGRTASTASTAPSASPADAPPPPPAPWNATSRQTAVLEPVDAPLGAPFSPHVTRRLGYFVSNLNNLQTAVDNANAGDQIILHGRYDWYNAGGRRYKDGFNMLIINKDITITATPGTATLDGRNAGRLIYVTGGTVVLDGLVLSGANAQRSVRAHMFTLLIALSFLSSPGCLLLDLD